MITTSEVKSAAAALMLIALASTGAKANTDIYVNGKPEKDLVIVGTLQAVNKMADQIVVKSTEGETATYRVSNGVSVMGNGQVKKFADLSAGESVMIMLDPTGSKVTKIRLK